MAERLLESRVFVRALRRPNPLDGLRLGSSPLTGCVRRPTARQASEEQFVPYNLRRRRPFRARLFRREGALHSFAAARLDEPWRDAAGEREADVSPGTAGRRRGRVAVTNLTLKTELTSLKVPDRSQSQHGGHAISINQI